MSLGSFSRLSLGNYEILINCFKILVPDLFKKQNPSVPYQERMNINCLIDHCVRILT